MEAEEEEYKDKRKTWKHIEAHLVLVLVVDHGKTVNKLEGD